MCPFDMSYIQWGAKLLRDISIIFFIQKGRRINPKPGIFVSFLSPYPSLYLRISQSVPFPLIFLRPGEWRCKTVPWAKIS